LLHHSLAQHHAVRQSGQRVVPCHVRQPRFGLAPFRNVLVCRNPPVIRRRPMMDGNDPAILELDNGVVRLVGNRDRAAPRQILVAAHFRERSGREPQIDDLRQRGSRVDRLRGQIVNFGIAPVGQYQSLLAVEKADALRQVVERHIEAVILDLQLMRRAAERMRCAGPGAGVGRKQASEQVRQ
jgi:hypothetical protein